MSAVSRGRSVRGGPQGVSRAPGGGQGPRMDLRLTHRTPLMFPIVSAAPLDFALSPDGMSLLFVASDDGPQRLWLRRLDKVEALPLAGTDGGVYPFGSPDGKSIGFFASGKLQVLALAGGAPRIVAAAIKPKKRNLAQ